MKIQTKSFEYNFKFYLFLKELNATKGIKKTIKAFLNAYDSNSNSPKEEILDLFFYEIEKIDSSDKKSTLNYLLLNIKDINDLKIFVFSLRLLLFKQILLDESKSKSNDEDKKNLLTIAYDRKGKTNAYNRRVKASLITSKLFNSIVRNKKFIYNGTNIDLSFLHNEYPKVKKLNINVNQVFMTMFSECVNQSIISDAGVSYEKSVLDTLIGLGINKESIKKTHDAVDKSMEFDFFFEIEKKKYGISAKRTLRERYKQFIKTALGNDIDVLIEITLGLDLTVEKANIIRKYNTFLFVADEIYDSKKELRDIEGVFPSRDLTLKNLKELARKEAKA